MSGRTAVSQPPPLNNTYLAPCNTVYVSRNNPGREALRARSDRLSLAAAPLTGFPGGRKLRRGCCCCCSPPDQLVTPDWFSPFDFDPGMVIRSSWGRLITSRAPFRPVSSRGKRSEMTLEFSPERPPTAAYAPPARPESALTDRWLHQSVETRIATCHFFLLERSGGGGASGQGPAASRRYGHPLTAL